MKIVRIAAAAALSLLASACLLTPGQFDSSLDLRRDGTFTYRYDGEILLFTGHSFFDAASGAGRLDSFDPEGETCWDETEEDVVERECTPEEIEERRVTWEEGKSARAAENERIMQVAKGMMGGVDPKDPETMDAFAARLEGMAGWKKVTHKGNGVFDVEYELAGRLDHDFVYPLFPNVEFVFPFVQAVRGDGGKVRVLAPAFTQGAEGAIGATAMTGALQGLSAMAKSDTDETIKKPSGTFTVTTDGKILTNNTTDGPTAAGAVSTLKWMVGPLDKQKPEALIQL